MMEFVDREEEIGRLRRQLERSEPSLIVVYGRRRLGKSTLLRHVLWGEGDESLLKRSIRWRS